MAPDHFRPSLMTSSAQSCCMPRVPVLPSELIDHVLPSTPLPTPLAQPERFRQVIETVLSSLDKNCAWRRRIRRAASHRILLVLEPGWPRLDRASSSRFIPSRSAALDQKPRDAKHRLSKKPLLKYSRNLATAAVSLVQSGRDAEFDGTDHVKPYLVGSFEDADALDDDGFEVNVRLRGLPAPWSTFVSDHDFHAFRDPAKGVYPILPLCAP